MSKDRKNNLVEQYFELSLKLGKLPSIRECNKFGISKSAIEYHYEKFTLFQNFVLEKHPELKKLQVPAIVKVHDVDSYRLQLEKKKINKSNISLIENVSTLEYIEQFAERVFSGKILSNNKSKPKESYKRTHNLILSDLHIGSDLKGDETGTQNFGLIEESRRLAAVIKEAGEYKEQYRKDTNLEILLLGDIIENQLHDPRTGAVISEQTCRAIHLLSQGIAYLANKYPSVNVRCSPGNHGRLTSRHPGRAIHQKFDSLEMIIYYSLKSACSNLKNVKFYIPKTPFAHYEVYGHKIGYTHGDTVVNPGNPGTALNVKSIENQVNRLNSCLPDRSEYSAIIYGHTHTAHLVYLNNGTILIGNGSLPPPDHFAVSIGIMESSNGQWIFESVPNHPVGDLRLIKCGKEYDKDVELDKIISPWKSFEE